ncbi:agmatine deiminase family protein [Nocardioides speluncae]|uniref:agmatine deiminase family protein n=1 Tax=Nocardioides speluncae TaxID=2670337 RepID=UPI000D68AEF7|nr:agmatine deiminase family protein [Nocardioides speluncae]
MSDHASSVTAPVGHSRRLFLARAGFATAGVVAASSGLGAALAQRDSVAAAGAFVVPAETAPHKRIWMAWPSSTSIWGSLLGGIQSDIAKLANEIVKHTPVIMCADGSTNAATARSRVSSAVTVISSIPVNDCWMRDSGAVFRLDGAGGIDAIGLNFNGWGGEQTHAKDALVAQRVAAYNGFSFTAANVVGEGGGVICDGDGTLIANRSSWIDAARNPGMTEAQIGAELLRMYGATKIIWCQGVSNQDITDDHIDATVLYTRPGAVLVQLAHPSKPSTVWSQSAIATRNLLAASTDAKGRQLQVTTIYGPETLPRVPAAQQAKFFDGYLNAVITDTAVITAQFGNPTGDNAAKAALETAFGRPCVQLNLDNLMGEGGGGAHCVTMEEPLPIGGPTGTPTVTPTPTPTPTSTVPTITADKTSVPRGGTIRATVANGPGNRRDWIGLYRASDSTSAGGYDEKYLNGSYSPPATGLTAATVSFTAPGTPGTYNFRFFANDSYTLLATSASFQVT